MYSNERDVKQGTIIGPQMTASNNNDDDDYYDDDDDDDSCQMRFWLSIEGNYSTPGSLSINIEDLKSGYMRSVWTAPRGYFPLNVYGFSRLITYPLTNNGKDFRVVIKGNSHREREFA